MGAGPASLEGLGLAKDHDWTAPSGKTQPHGRRAGRRTAQAAAERAGPALLHRHPANAADEQAGDKPDEGK